MGRAFEFRKARKMKRWSAMAKAFTRIGKDIVMAVKDGGPNPETNSKLRAVIQNAKSVNMPKDNIERAIKKASDKDTANYKEVLFEGYAPHGIAIIIETATDNNNRTVANIRSYFNKFNGTLGTQGSVEFMFDHICNFRINDNLNTNNEYYIKKYATTEEINSIKRLSNETQNNSSNNQGEPKCDGGSDEKEGECLFGCGESGASKYSTPSKVSSVKEANIGEMMKTLSEPREDFKAHVPRIENISVPEDAIGGIIGKGGETIRRLVEETGAQIDVEDSGKVTVYGDTPESRSMAVERINALTEEPEINKIYTGKVANIVDFGAFVTIMPGRDGLVHVS